MLLQQKIDDVLNGVHLSDLLSEEQEVRVRVGLGGVAMEHDPRALPILQG
jgi:hypothetical protein